MYQNVAVEFGYNPQLFRIKKLIRFIYIFTNFIN